MKSKTQKRQQLHCKSKRASKQPSSQAAKQKKQKAKENKKL